MCKRTIGRKLLEYLDHGQNQPLATRKTMQLSIDERRFSLSAEILLGARTVAEYLLSPVLKVLHEAW